MEKRKVTHISLSRLIGVDFNKSIKAHRRFECSFEDTLQGWQHDAGRDLTDDEKSLASKLWEKQSKKDSK